MDDFWCVKYTYLEEVTDTKTLDSNAKSVENVIVVRVHKAWLIRVKNGKKIR